MSEGNLRIKLTIKNLDLEHRVKASLSYLQTMSLQVSTYIDTKQGLKNPTEH